MSSRVAIATERDPRSANNTRSIPYDAHCSLDAVGAQLIERLALILTYRPCFGDIGPARDARSFATESRGGVTQHHIDAVCVGLAAVDGRRGRRSRLRDRRWGRRGLSGLRFGFRLGLRTRKLRRFLR